MEWWLRLFYNLYWPMGLLPFAFLWMTVFDEQLRISRRLFWGLYAVHMLALLLVANLWHWPGLLSIEEQQFVVLCCLPLWLGLFWLAWGRFFVQVFLMGCAGVFGLAMYTAPLLMAWAPFSPMPYHVRACFCFALIWAFCFRYLRRTAGKVMRLLLNVNDGRSWRIACLLPAGFFLLPYAYIRMQTIGNAMPLSALSIRLLALAGLAATLYTLAASAALLERNTIFLENMEQANVSYQAWQERSLLALAEFRKARQLRHDLRHYCINLRYLLETGDWERFGQMVAECKRSLDDAQSSQAEGGEQHAESAS